MEEILSLKPFIRSMEVSYKCKFQLNISKIMPPRPKTTLGHGFYRHAKNA